MPVPAFAGTGSGGHPALDPRVRGDERRLSQRFTCQTAKSCSQVLQPSLQYKQASSPVLFGEAPGRPVFPFVSPQKMRGLARQGAQPLFFMCPHSLSEIRGAARRATQTSLRSLGSFAASSLRRRAALFVAVRNVTASVSQLLAGGPYWPPGGAPAPPGCVLCEARPRAPHPTPPA